MQTCQFGILKLTSNILKVSTIRSTSKAQHVRTLVTNHVASLNGTTRFYSDSHVASLKTDKPQEGILKRIISKFGWADNSKTRLRVTGYLLYENVADKISYVDFFKQCNLPDTFNSWFLVTELHVWMLLVRSMAEGDQPGEDGRFLRNCIIEALWSDVATRTKKLGTSNPSGLRAHIQELSQQFQASLISYDEGLCSPDIVLAGALWHRFFPENCTDAESLEMLLKYVRKQVKLLDAIPREKFISNPQITWISFREE